jgi:hypothetical protein
MAGAKSQGPNPKSQGNPKRAKNQKIPTKRRDAFSSFPRLVICKFGFCLGFGAWDLEFLAHATLAVRRTSIVFALPAL